MVTPSFAGRQITELHKGRCVGRHERTHRLCWASQKSAFSVRRSIHLQPNAPRISALRAVCEGLLGALMKSSVVKRSIVIDGHKTSVSLEDPFWNDLKMIARTRSLTLSELVAAINASRDHSNLSSAIRLYVLSSFRSEDGRTDVADAGAAPVSA